MHRVIDVALTGHDRPFHVHDDAYDALSRYLAAARSRLGADPDAADVVADLERSIGERLGALAGPDARVLSATDVMSVLDEVGAVEPPSPGISPAPARPRPARRKLYRIREGQDIAGVCNGLATYSDIDVGWVRTIFFLGALVTGGVLGIVYIVMMFVLPVIDSREAWLAAMAHEDASRET
jgi:phage shock protein PspC (stress-responsive transcriptional regulator)